MTIEADLEHAIRTVGGELLKLAEHRWKNDHGIEMAHMMLLDTTLRLCIGTVAGFSRLQPEKASELWRLAKEHGDTLLDDTLSGTEETFELKVHDA